jgi:hypothetical protein
MSDHVNRPNNTDAEIECLARETDMPLELVQEIYTIERANLERTARIKTYTRTDSSTRKSSFARATGLTPAINSIQSAFHLLMHGAIETYCYHS